MTSLNEYYNMIGIKMVEGYSQEITKETDFLKREIKNSNIVNIMEIGFNGGHSADIFLSENVNSKVISFDLGSHEYVYVGKDYIDKKYPNRHELILGDSKQTIPLFVMNNVNKKFDFIFIDGGHEYIDAKSDLINCKKLAHENTIIVMDDTINDPLLMKFWNIGPTKVWNEAKDYEYVIEFGTEDYDVGRGCSWGKYKNL